MKECYQEELDSLHGLIGSFAQAANADAPAACNLEAGGATGTTATATTTTTNTATQSDVEGAHVDSTDFALKELRQRLDYLKNLYDIKDQVRWIRLQ